LRQQNFSYSKRPYLSLGPIPPLVEWATGIFPGEKAAGACPWLHTTILEPRLILVRTSACEFMARYRETFTFRRNCSPRVLHMSVSSTHLQL